MAYLPSLLGDSVLLDVFRAYRETSRPLPDYHEALLRGRAPLSANLGQGNYQGQFSWPVNPGYVDIKSSGGATLTMPIPTVNQ
jgi:hypothetical protein